MKIVNILNKLVAFMLICCFSQQLFAAKQPVVTSLPLPTPDPLGQQLYDNHNWSLLYYYGQTVNGALVGTVIGNFKHWPEHIQTLDLAYTLDQDNAIRHLVRNLCGVIQIAANVTVRQGNNEHTIYEFDPYMIFRWANWPWNHYVTTSFAFSEGVSYDTSIPAIERKNNNTNTRRLLNYMMFEATFARPSYPELQFVLRVHHRSGMFGLYHAGNTGSNDIGAGIRYLF